MKCVQEKESIMGLRGDRKIRPSNHSLAALGKPRDARHWSSGRDGYFYLHLTPMTDPYSPSLAITVITITGKPLDARQ